MTPKFDPHAVILRIKVAAERVGTIPEVAKACDLKEPTLAGIPRGQSLPNTTTMVALCTGLGVSADWLLFGEVRP